MRDHRRLQHAAKATGKSLSELARQGLLLVLEEIERVEQERLETENFFRQFSNSAKNLVLSAKHEAELLSTPLVGSQHLLLSIASDDKLGKILSMYNAPFAVLKSTLEDHAGLFASYYTESVTEPYSPTFVRIMDRSRLLAKRMLDSYVQPEHLFLALLEQGTGTAYNVLEFLGFPYEAAQASLMKEFSEYRKEPRWRRKTGK